MAAEYTHTNAFRGATLRDADLTGATFRECDLTQVRIVASQVADLRVSDCEHRRFAVRDLALLETP